VVEVVEVVEGAATGCGAMRACNCWTRRRAASKLIATFVGGRGASL
jgi:hypothetical protein